jgi:hypothetical protein
MVKKHNKKKQTSRQKKGGKKYTKGSRGYSRGRRYNGGGDLKMLRNPQNVRNHVTIRHTYTNSCVIPSITFTNTAQGAKRNVSIAMFLNSPYIFRNGGANSNGIIWSNEVVDTFSPSNTPDLVDSYAAGDNWSFKYKTAQVIGARIEINVRCLRDANDTEADNTSVCPLAISLVRQATPGMAEANPTELIRNRPYCMTKYINTDSKERSTECFFDLRHSPRKFNGLQKGNFIGAAEYIFPTASSSTGQVGNSVPEEQDNALFVISPACTAMLKDPINRTKSPQLMCDFKISKYIRYSEPNYADNQPVPLMYEI